MIVLGIDPGYAIVGCGVVEYKNNHFTMLDYGAVNACSLDGGSSTCMWFNGEYLNSISGGSGARWLPDAFLVK